MPEKTGVIRFAVRKFAPFEAALQATWQAYCQQTNCQLQLEAVPLELHELHDATLVQQGLKNGTWDIAHLNTDWIAEAHAAGAVTDFASFLKQNPPHDYPQGWSKALLQMQQFGEAVVGLPFHDGPECLIYRKDLFEDPAEKEAYYKQYKTQLAPPRTWDEFVQIACFFQRPDKGLYGTLLAAYPDGHNTVFDFCLQLWTRGGELLNSTGELVIDSEAAQEGLAFYRSLWHNTAAIHPHSQQFDSVKAGQAFANGEVAMMVNWFGFAAVCDVDAASAVKGKVDITHIPHGPQGQGASLNVYWMYTLGSGSRYKDVAYDFIRFAINAQNDKNLTLAGGIGCRLSTWHDADINQLVPYYHKLEELHAQSRTLPRYGYWAQAAAVIDTVVLEAAHTQLPVAEILQKGQHQLNQLFAENGNSL